MKKLICLLLAAVMLVGIAACGKSSDESEAAVSAPLDAPSAGEEPQGEPAAPDDAAYLTGLQKTADYPEGQRVIGVMVNNIAQARPLSGLSDADVLVEIKVEGGITRFLAMYTDYTKMPRVGPIRSARDQFFQLLDPTQGFYLHIGESVVQSEYKRTENYEDFDINGDYFPSLISRDAARSAAGYAYEHTAYSDGAAVTEQIASSGLNANHTYDGTYLNFQSYAEAPRVPGDGMADSVPIIHSAGYRTLFEYNAANANYLMSQFNSNNGSVEDSIDENNGQQLAFDNLLVLFTDISTYPGHEASDLQHVEFGRGPGFYFSNGGYEFVLWEKGSPIEPLRILSGAEEDNEAPITINPGRSYISFVDYDQWDDFYENVTTGAGEAAIADGEVGYTEDIE